MPPCGKRRFRISLWCIVRSVGTLTWTHAARPRCWPLQLCTLIDRSGKALTKEQVDASGIAALVRGYVDFNGVLINITGAHQCYGTEADQLLRRLATALPGTAAAPSAVPSAVPSAAGAGAGAGSSSSHPSAASAASSVAPPGPGGTGGAAGGGRGPRRWRAEAPLKKGSPAAAPPAPPPAEEEEPELEACPPCDHCPPCPVSTRSMHSTAPRACTAGGAPPPRSWGLITCNDNVDMSAVKVKGVGGDAFWPPGGDVVIHRNWSAASVKGDWRGARSFSPRGPFSVSPPARDRFHQLATSSNLISNDT